MKLLMGSAAAAFFAIAAFGVAQARGGGHSGSSSHMSTGDHYVHTYVRKDGTVVEGHHQTNPNGTRNDNYSTRRNVNPYTGEPGTKPRDGEGPN